MECISSFRSAPARAVHIHIFVDVYINVGSNCVDIKTALEPKSSS